MTSARAAARAILAGVEKNRERVYVGVDAKLMAAAKRVIPETTVRAFGAASSDRALGLFGGRS